MKFSKYANIILLIFSCFIRKLYSIKCSFIIKYQQQVQINELLDKHSSMNKEVTEARLDAQDLSHQVMELEKMIESNCASPVDQTPIKKKYFIFSKTIKLHNNIDSIMFINIGTL